LAYLVGYVIFALVQLVKTPYKEVVVAVPSAVDNVLFHVIVVAVVVYLLRNVDGLRSPQGVP
jgi:hypothetical protein